jgi:four helix bundle protein
MQDFRKLVVWEKSHQLAVKVYQQTANFPREELFGLTSQIRRSAFSVPTNIAEGCGRDSQADMLRFLRISMGSASELDYELILAHDLNLLDDASFEMLSQELLSVRKMLSSLVQRLKTDISTRNTKSPSIVK